MSLEQQANFFKEFPEFLGNTVFTDDAQSLEELSEKLKNLDSSVSINSIPFHNRSCCVAISVNGQAFYIINVDESYDFWGAVAWPLLVHDSDNQIFQDFTIHHEIGHALSARLNPYDISSNSFMMSDKDAQIIHEEEEFADCYAALRMIQIYGDRGVEFVVKMADTRLLSAVKSNKTMHLTTHVLDKVCERAKKDISFIKSKAPQDLVHLATELCADLKGVGSVAIKRLDLENWQKSIFSTSLDNYLLPKTQRLLDAITRQVDVPEEEVNSYIESVGFSKGDLSQSFRNSAILKAIIGIKIPLFSPEEIQDVHVRIEQAIISPSSSVNSNQYPELDGFIAESKRAFVGDQFALLSALSSEGYVNSLAQKFLTRRALERVASYSPLGV